MRAHRSVAAAHRAYARSPRAHAASFCRSASRMRTQPACARSVPSPQRIVLQAHAARLRTQ
eukprot:4460727-Pleurochrysis_carterae.AAC.1